MKKISSLFLILIIFLCHPSCVTKKVYSHLPESVFQEVSAEIENPKERSYTYTDYTNNSTTDVLQIQTENKKPSVIQTKTIKETKEKQFIHSKMPSSLAIKGTALHRPLFRIKEIVPEKTPGFLTMVFIAFFFPPMAVGMKKGFGSWYFFLTLGLTLSLLLPGMVYALLVIIRNRNN